MPNYSPVVKIKNLCDYNAESSENILGKKMIIPIINAETAEMRTAPAAISFVFLAKG